VPDVIEQKKLAKVLLDVDNKIEINKQIKNKLTQLKKGLMQDLLSGRVRVK
jgi:type I restriction enzyme S subunit